MHVKVKYKQTKNRRINRFPRNNIVMIEKRMEDKNFHWYSDYEKFTLGKKIVFVKREWEKERLSKGLPCYTTSDFESDGLSNNLFAFTKTHTVKSAKRKIRKFIKFFPTGTRFENFGGWIGFDIEFIVKNPEYNEEKLKEELYFKLKLGEKYTKLSSDFNTNNLTTSLRNAGYFVSLGENNEGYVLGKNIRAAFLSYKDDNYKSSEKFIADNDNCFDKWSRCAIKIKFPKSKKEISDLLRELEYLASEEGMKKSQNYDYEYKFVKIK